MKLLKKNKLDWGMVKLGFVDFFFLVVQINFVGELWKNRNNNYLFKFPCYLELWKKYMYITETNQEYV